MNKKSNSQTPVILTAAAVLFTLLVRFVNVQAIGPQESKVGFAALNGAFAKLIGVHKSFYVLTEILGLLAILTAVFFAAVGLMQLIKRKDLRKVDAKIWVQGGFYVVLILVYLFFEVVVINYRPVLEEGKLAASYPSSHTLAAICLFGAAIPLYRYYIRNKALLQAAVIGSAACLIVTVLGRILSGYHWITDIAGGILIAAALLSWLEYARNRFA